MNPRRNIGRHIVPVALLLSTRSFATTSDDGALVCPERWPEGILSVKRAFGPWTPSVTLPAPLVTVTVFRGPPEDQGELMPHSGSSTSTESVEKFRFSGTDDDPPVWIRCEYSGLGALGLSRPVPGHPSVCVVHSTLDGAKHVETTEVRCR